MPRPDAGKCGLQFPPYDQVVPHYAGETKDGTVTIGVDVDKLRALADAIGAGGGKRARHVSLTFPIPQTGAKMIDPIVVRMQSHPEALGILMPVRVPA